MRFKNRIKNTLYLCALAAFLSGCPSASPIVVGNRMAMAREASQQDWTEVIAAGRRITSHSPNHAEAWAYIAVAAAHLDSFEVMTGAIVRSLTISDKHIQYMSTMPVSTSQRIIYLAENSRERGDIEMSQRLFKLANRIDPSDSATRRRLGEARVPAPLSSMPRATLTPLPVEERISLAVAGFTGLNISDDESHILSDRLRVEFGNTGRYKVIERQKMNDILQEQGFQQSGLCDTEACVVEMGKLIGVQEIVVGSIGKLGHTYTISARIIDIETGHVRDQAARDCRCEIDALLAGMRKIAIDLSK